MVLVVGHITVPQQGPLDEDSHGAPAQQDDGQLKEVPLVPEVSPPLLLHQFALRGKKKTRQIIVASNTRGAISRKNHHMCLSSWC